MSGISSFGSTLEWYDSATTTWNAVGLIGDISGPSTQLKTQEVTTHDSTGGWAEYIPTILDAGEVTFTVNYIPSRSDQAWSASTGLPYMMINRQEVQFRIGFPDANWVDGSSNPKHLEFNAYVTSWSIKAPVSGKLSADVKLRITGGVTEA